MPPHYTYWLALRYVAKRVALEMMDSNLHLVTERPKRAEAERIQERLATNLRT